MALTLDRDLIVQHLVDEHSDKLFLGDNVLQEASGQDLLTWHMNAHGFTQINQLDHP